LCACTSMFSEERSLSACSLFFTIVTMTESSIEPVGAPAGSSRVRTIVVPRSMSAWRSVGARRHSLMWLVTSVVEFEATLEADVLPVALVDPVALTEEVEPVAAPAWADVVSLLATAVLAELVEVLAVADGEVVLIAPEVELVSLLATLPVALVLVEPVAESEEEVVALPAALVD